MRARRGRLWGWLVVGAFATALVAATVTTPHDQPARRAAPAGEGAAEALIRAWERSRRATFVTTGTYERHSEVTGASIASTDVVAQRPPRRIHRQLGGVDGRDDDRLVVCPAAPPDAEPPPCRLGRPGGRTYDASVADEVEGLRTILLGAQPLYAVTARGDGCFALEQVRPDPRAPFGVEASFCFDAATGAPSGHRVRHAGGIEEKVVVTDIRTEVTDDDLQATPEVRR
jgi:hypothetical protein